MISPRFPDSASGPRQSVFDDAKRRTILALLANGSSLRAAARHVGCHPVSITRLAARDPEFAQRMAAAQQNLEVECLRAIRKAASQNDQWRAAAWLLQHKYSDDFGSRRPNTFTVSQLFDLLAEVAEKMLGSVPLADYQATADCLDEFIQATRREVDARYFPPAQRVAQPSFELALADLDRKDFSDNDSDDEH